MNLTTSQCRSVSSGMPLSRAISSAICSFHWSGWVKNPSASTSTVVSAISSVVIGSSSGRGRWDVLLARERHRRAETRNLPPRQQHVPVHPLEHELAEVIETGLPQQRQGPGGCREAARKRLDVVVEVDEQGLVEARLDEAIRMAVVARIELLPFEEPDDVLRQHLTLEVD